MLTYTPSIQKEKVFLNYIHYFRGLAIVFIVGIHACIAVQWESELSHDIVLSLLSNGTVLFVFVSGFLFYYLSSQKFNYLIYLSKKVKYVIIPYLFVSFPAIVDKLLFDNGNHWWMDSTFEQFSVIEKVAYMLFTGKHFGPFWFIPMIALFYIIAPILIKVSKYKLFDFAVPILVFLGLYSVAFGYNTDIFTSFLYFLPVYLYGMLIAKYREKIISLPLYLLVILIFSFLLLTILEVSHIIPLEELRVYKPLTASYNVFNYGKMKALILTLILINIFYQFNTRDSRLFKLLGDYSFGIFFIHLYLINLFLIGFNYINFSFLTDFWHFIIFTSIVLITSVSFISLTKLVFKRNSRYFIGS